MDLKKSKKRRNRKHRYREQLRDELLAAEISDDVVVAAEGFSGIEVHFHFKILTMNTCVKT